MCFLLLCSGIEVNIFVFVISLLSGKYVSLSCYCVEVKKMFVDDVVPILEALDFNTTAAQQQAQSLADLEEKIAAVSK